MGSLRWVKIAENGTETDVAEQGGKESARQTARFGRSVAGVQSGKVRRARGRGRGVLSEGAFAGDFALRAALCVRPANIRHRRQLLRHRRTGTPRPYGCITHKRSNASGLNGENIEDESKAAVTSITTVPHQ